MERKRKSLFAQRMERQQQINKEKNIEISQIVEINFGEQSYIVQGNDADGIHNENINKLKSMSINELNTERENLLTSLNSTTVEFLKNRRKHKSNDSSLQSKPINEQKKVKFCDHVTEENSEEVKELYNKFPNMSIVEKEKLKWIGELPDTKPIGKNEEYNARFDFEGNLLPYKDQGEGVLKGLHNHGEEQERPGYTVQELMQLSRSSVLQQRIIALNTLSNVMLNAFKYNICFTEPLIPCLLDANMFLLLRFSLDDESRSIVTASLNALSNLLVKHSDEACLDALIGAPLGLQQPILNVALELKKKEIDELKDIELLKLDLIKGCLRTQILERLNYIVEKLNPNSNEILCIAKILIRICRHSSESVQAVISHPRLLQNIFKMAIHTKVPECLKLFRVIFAYSKLFTESILLDCSISEIIIHGMALSNPSDMFFNLECWYTWQILLTYKLEIDILYCTTPVIFEFLKQYFTTIDLSSSNLDIQHATAVLSCIAIIAQIDFTKIELTDLLCDCIQKWLTQILSIEFTFYTSKLIGRCITLLSRIYKNEKLEKGSAVLQIFFNQILSNPEKLLYEKIEKIQENSFLIQEPIINTTSLPNLDLEPIKNNPVAYLYSLANVILNMHQDIDFKIIKLFLDSITPYVKQILTNSRKVISWYGRQEINFLITIIRLIHETKYYPHSIYFNLCFYLLGNTENIFTVTELLRKGIFTPIYYVDLVNEYKIDKDLNEIKQIYFKALELPLTENVNTQLSVQVYSQNTFPLDWPYYPLHRLHNVKDLKVDNNLIADINFCLKYIYALENLNPYSTELQMDATTRYTRIALIYLIADDFFMNFNDLLNKILDRQLINNEFNFENEIPGLKSFYDLYREFCDQFLAVSYSNVTFGRYVLVPLQQRHHSKYKKLVWSEMEVILRLLNVPIELVNIKDYLEPYETDESLILIYFYALAKQKVREIWSPLLYKIAVHHVSCYIKNNDNSTSKFIIDRTHKLQNKELCNLLMNYQISKFD